MKSLHFLLTYQCTRSCPHCFVWGSPNAHHSMSDDQVEHCLDACVKAGIGQVCFEGGEPFLRFSTLLRSLEAATSRGLSPDAVTNGFWATDGDRARRLLSRLKDAGLTSLMVSTDDYHGAQPEAHRASIAIGAARDLGIPVTVARTALNDVMFRGRAANCLSRQVEHLSPETFTACPHENLASPERVHVDAWGYLHLCQGLVMGRIAEDEPLEDVLSAYRADTHPIVRPILNGGPVALAREHGVHMEDGYADACHLCYRARETLRDRFPELLAPGPMYGIKEDRGASSSGMR